MFTKRQNGNFKLPTQKPFCHPAQTCTKWAIYSDFRGFLTPKKCFFAIYNKYKRMLDNLPRLWYHITIKFRANRVRLCCCAGRFKTGCRCEEFHRRASSRVRRCTFYTKIHSQVAKRLPVKTHSIPDAARHRDIAPWDAVTFRIVSQKTW